MAMARPRPICLTAGRLSPVSLAPAAERGAAMKAAACAMLLKRRAIHSLARADETLNGLPSEARTAPRDSNPIVTMRSGHCSQGLARTGTHGAITDAAASRGRDQPLRGRPATTNPPAATNSEAENATPMPPD